jgi:DNA-binding GntR family transcriptional regulator
LRQALVFCEIEPGQFVAEHELAERFALGRAAVRVALTALEVSGLIVRHPRQGWRATPITANLVRAVNEARARLEVALSEGRLTSAERMRLEQLAGITAALEGRVDSQAIMTMRAADRGIRDALAARTNELTRRWLAEAWDHRDRVVRALERAGIIVPAPDRRQLIAALANGDRAVAAAWLRRDLAREAKALADGIARAGEFGAASPARSARRRRRVRDVAIFDQQIRSHHRQE